MSVEIGIDLGTNSVLVYVKDKGVILKEPTLVAWDRNTKEIKAIGEEARLMVGNTSGNVLPVCPFHNGKIVHYEAVEQMIKYFVQKAMGRRVFKKPRISISVPAGASEQDRKAVETATYEAGARDVVLVEEPMAAALGAGIDISKSCGNLLVDIGGEVTDLTVISDGNVVASKVILAAGDAWDRALIRYMRTEHHLLIGERVAEHLKMKLGTLDSTAPEIFREVVGRVVETGVEAAVEVSSKELLEPLQEVARTIAREIQTLLEETDPSLVQDIRERSMVLTGGGALLPGLEGWLETETGIATLLAEEPLKVVAVGTGQYVEFMNAKQEALKHEAELKENDVSKTED